MLGYAAWVEYYHQVRVKTNIKFNERTGYGNNKYYKRFRQIGEMCQKEGIDPSDYIRVAFDLITDNYRYFTPVDFTNPNLFEMYKKHKTAYGQDCIAMWAIQVDALVRLECLKPPDSKVTEEDMLMSGANSFVSWFRVFYPDKFSERIFDAYGKSAWSELQADKPLRLLLREHRPKHMEEIERRIGYFGDAVLGANFNGAIKQRIQS